MNRIDSVTDEIWATVCKENRDMVEEYLKQSKTLSDYTLKQYESALKIYFFWIHENKNDTPFHKIKSRDFLHYQNYLSECELSSSAIKFKRSAVSSLNNYILLYYEDEFPVFKNYINKGIPSPSPVFVNEKKPLNLEEYKHLCDILEEKELWQLLAYIKFSFSSGARRNEVRQLTKDVISSEPKNITDSDGNNVEVFSTGRIRCKGRGKAGKVRTLNFDVDAMNSIKKWLEFRGEDECPYVFVTGHGENMKQVGENIFNLWGDKYIEPIVGRRFHPHLLRESRATSMVVEQKKDINSAKKLLGHQSSETTQIYIIREDEDEADDAFM